MTRRAALLVSILALFPATARAASPDSAVVRTVAARSRRGAAEKGAAGGGPSSNVKDLEVRLTRALGTKVEVHDRGKKGEVVIPYGDLDALDRIIDKLLK